MSELLGSVVEFFDPHPGIAGALSPVPTPVKEVINRLAGSRQVLRDAVNQIKGVTPGVVTVRPESNCILLTLSVSWREECWRLITYRKVR